jgi:phage virion morphogenesis protein
MQPILKTIGEDIKDRAEKRFKTSTGPDGSRWRPNARSTIEAYIRKQGGFGKKGINRKGQTLATAKRPLIGLSKSLMSQFHMHADAHSVTVSNTMIYAAIQQFSGQAGRGKKVRIPARPFLPVRLDGSLYPQEQAKILELLNGYLMAC